MATIQIPDNLVADIREYAHAPISDHDYLTKIAHYAMDLVAHIIGTSRVPDTVRYQATLEVAKAKYAQRAQITDVTVFGDNQTSQSSTPGIRPETAALRALRPYLRPVIA